MYTVSCFTLVCIPPKQTDKTEGEKIVDACPLKLVDATNLAKK